MSEQRHSAEKGLHRCIGCGVELDGDDPARTCEDCCSASHDGHPCGRCTPPADPTPPTEDRA